MSVLWITLETVVRLPFGISFASEVSKKEVKTFMDTPKKLQLLLMTKITAICKRWCWGGGKLMDRL